MYLRCSHNDCWRIDWRTVHGLQCHIVKNHEQPKGTIGSLEKALDKYGVPVAEVEEYEERNGYGSGGTMADPKNMKMKSKMATRPSDVSPSTMHVGNTQLHSPQTFSTPPPASAPASTLFPIVPARSPTAGLAQEDIVYSDEEEDERPEAKGSRAIFGRDNVAPPGSSEQAAFENALERMKQSDAPVRHDSGDDTKVQLIPVETADVIDSPKDTEMATTESRENTVGEIDEADQKPEVEGDIVQTEASTRPATPPLPQTMAGQSPGPSTTPSRGPRQENEAVVNYNHAQSELQGNTASTTNNDNSNTATTNNESLNNSDNDDSIVVNNPKRSPKNTVTRTRAGRFVKKTSISKSPAYKYQRKGSDH